MKWPRTLTIPRQPDFIIGKPEAPYMRRWWIIPRNRFFNIYLHNILRPDDDRALHDHPWASCSIILRGLYYEHTPDGKFKIRKPGMIRFRKATAAHRISLFGIGYRGELDKKTGRPVFTECYRPAWTLFITGPKVREWGFHCPKGWRHWREFVGVRDGEARGDEDNVGCGD